LHSQTEPNQTKHNNNDNDNNTTVICCTRQAIYA